LPQQCAASTHLVPPILSQMPTILSAPSEAELCLPQRNQSWTGCFSRKCPTFPHYPFQCSVNPSALHPCSDAPVPVANGPHSVCRMIANPDASANHPRLSRTKPHTFGNAFCPKIVQSQSGRRHTRGKKRRQKEKGRRCKNVGLIRTRNSLNVVG
jgi:hypothetical protein